MNYLALFVLAQVLFILMSCLQQGITLKRLQIYFIGFLLCFIMILLFPYGSALIQNPDTLDSAILLTLIQTGAMTGFFYLISPYLILTIFLLLNGGILPIGLFKKLLIACISFASSPVIYSLFPDHINELVQKNSI